MVSLLDSSSATQSNIRFQNRWQQGEGRLCCPRARVCLLELDSSAVVVMTGSWLSWPSLVIYTSSTVEQRFLSGLKQIPSTARFLGSCCSQLVAGMSRGMFSYRCQGSLQGVWNAVFRAVLQPESRPAPHVTWWER